MSPLDEPSEFSCRDFSKMPKALNYLECSVHPDMSELTSPRLCRLDERERR